MLSLTKLPRLFTVHQIPKAYHEDGIIFGYRHPCSSATDCVLSLFRLTNETLNVWTHFLPTWYFLWKLLTVVCTQDVWSDMYTWPFLVFLLSCCIYPLASSCAHTFSTMSTRSRHICYFFDYGALSLYSLGSAIAYSAYVIPDVWVNSWFHLYYIPLAVCNTVISTSMSCYSRFYESRNLKVSKILRITAFTYPFLFDNIPLFYRLCLCDGDGCTVNEATSLHVCHILLAFLTGFLFATHLPERLAPGRFDYIGHSHQLFHVCAIISTYVQMQAVQCDMDRRRPWLHAHAPAITFSGTLGASALSVLFSLLIIFVFSRRLFLNPEFNSTGVMCCGAVRNKHGHKRKLPECSTLDPKRK